MRRVVWWVLRIYQLTLSSLVGRQCRFEPTCSHYAQEAVLRFGVVKGGMLAAKRVARCGPLGGSGYDPVPETWEQRRGGAALHCEISGKGKVCSCCKH